jgi:hypothetical protein
MSLVKNVSSGLFLNEMVLVVRGDLLALARWQVASADVRTSLGGEWRG